MFYLLLNIIKRAKFYPLSYLKSMSIKLDYLKPSDVEIEIDGHIVKIRPMTLALEVWAIENYGTLADFFEKLDTEPHEFVLKIHKLAYFESPFAFGSWLGSIKNSATALTLILEGFKISALRSIPVVNPERQKALSEALGSEFSDPNYAEYYDRLARRYGYSLEEFFGLTPRQLQILLEACGDGDYSDLEVQASLAGRKLKPRIKYDLHVSKEEEQKRDEAGKAATAELWRRYNERQAKNG